MLIKQVHFADPYHTLAMIKLIIQYIKSLFFQPAKPTGAPFFLFL